MFHDLRYAVRMLARTPGFTAVAVLSLALAIGVNSGVFTIVNALFLRPVIPLRAEEVVNVYTAREGAERDYRAFAYSEYSLLRESTDVFADVAAYQFAGVGVGEPGAGGIRRAVGFVVSESYFSMLGAAPAAGRFFLPEESQPNVGIPVAVVSPGLWDTLSGGAGFSPRAVAINGETWTIVGVAPRGFSGGNSLLAPDIWLPMGMASRVSEAFAQTRDIRDVTDPANHAFFVMARLPSGTTLDHAQARLPALATRLTSIASDGAKGPRTIEIGPPSRFGISTEPPSDGPLAVFGALLLGMAGVVLLVACLNLANMFLARGTARSRELAVRFALGASRWRVVRLLLVEGSAIALLGGAAGLLLSQWGNTLLLDSLTRSSVITKLGFSLALDVAPDVRVIAATLAFCAAATIVFGMAPALRSTRDRGDGQLRLHGAEKSPTEHWGRLFSGRQILLMAQLACSLVLLFSAGLFLHAARTAAHLDVGFAPEGDLVAELDYTLVERENDQVSASVLASVDALKANPDVGRVAVASHVPFGGVVNSMDVSTSTTDDNATRVHGRITAVSAGYFDTMGVPLLRGRDFSDVEWRQPGGARVVIIDERAASALFPGEDPIGRHVWRVARGSATAGEAMEIVGVVGAHRDRIFADAPPSRIFFPLAQRPPTQVFLHVRGRSADGGAMAALAGIVRNELRQIDEDVPLLRVEPLTAMLDGNIELWSVRFAAVLFATFGSIALLLAVVGVYGVKAFSVARRTRELGIRMALGASTRTVLALLMKQGAIQIAIGLAVGMALALAAGQLLASMLVQVSPHDPVILAAATLPLGLATLVASWLPARRATRVNPVEALRAE